MLNRLILITSVVALAAGCGGTSGAKPVAQVAQPAAQKADRQLPASFTIAATGDFLQHGVINDQAQEDGNGEDYDFRPMLSAIEPVISAADLAICHIETPFAPRSGPFSGYPIFNSPPHIADAAKGLGYDTCSTASNHTIDKGAPGVERTLSTLDKVGLKHAGSARTADEAQQINLIDVKGVKVAHLSYTYGTNGIPLPSGKPWIVNRIDAGAIEADAKRAKSQGAEVVVLSMQWGEEYQHAATDEQVTLARRLLASPDIDLIIGHHVHVVQPFEKVGDKWVAYGIGNLVANPVANAQTTHEGVLARFTFTRDAQTGRWLASPEMAPTVVQPGPPIRLVDVRTQVDDSDRYAETMARTSRIVRSRGAGVPVLK